jgi:hypothetical protein
MQCGRAEGHFANGIWIGVMTEAKVHRRFPAKCRRPFFLDGRILIASEYGAE